MEWIPKVSEWVRANLSLLGLVVTWAGIALVWVRRRAEWRCKNFLNQVNGTVKPPAEVVGDMELGIVD